MQRPDEAKRQAIIDAGAELFATRQFHEVRLEDVADAAHVGKGTLYIYFKNKDDLYGSLILEGFTQLVERLRKQVEVEQAATNGNDVSAWETLTTIVRELVGWAKKSPHFFQLMRPGQENPSKVPGLREKRQEIAKLIEQTIVRGVKRGEICDPRPDLTAQFIPSCVRGALRHGPANVGQDVLTNHIMRVLAGGILKKQQ